MSTSQRESERETETETDRQRDRQTDRHIETEGGLFVNLPISSIVRN